MESPIATSNVVIFNDRFTSIRAVQLLGTNVERMAEEY
jgi:hypothetical protein